MSKQKKKNNLNKITTRKNEIQYFNVNNFLAIVQKKCLAKVQTSKCLHLEIQKYNVMTLLIKLQHHTILQLFKFRIPQKDFQAL